MRSQWGCEHPLAALFLYKQQPLRESLAYLPHCLLGNERVVEILDYSSERLLKTKYKVDYPVSESIRTSEMSMDLRAATTVFADLSNVLELIDRYHFAGWNVCPAKACE
jgi:hypothetical protein